MANRCTTSAALSLASSAFSASAIGRRSSVVLSPLGERGWVSPVCALIYVSTVHGPSVWSWTRPRRRRPASGALSHGRTGGATRHPSFRHGALRDALVLKPLASRFGPCSSTAARRRSQRPAPRARRPGRARGVGVGEHSEPAHALWAGFVEHAGNLRQQLRSLHESLSSGREVRGGFRLQLVAVSLAALRRSRRISSEALVCSALASSESSRRS